MKRTVLVGVAMFLLGGAASPRAANNDETLALLCKRFELTAAAQDLAHSKQELRRLWKDEKNGTIQQGLFELERRRNEAIVISLEGVRAMVCVP